MVRFYSQTVVVLAASVAVGSATVSHAAAAPAKPLVIVFADPAADSAPNGGVTATEQSPDGLMNTQRTQIAARAVRDRFKDSSVADAILYNPESPVFLRATSEAKLQLKNLAFPSAADRLALGRAIGAVSVVAIRAQSLKDKPGSVEIVLESTDVDSRKTWSDKAMAGGGSVLSILPGDVSVGESNQRTTPVQSTAWMTVSNTLVLRYLAGPLGEYTRALAPPGMVTIPKATPVDDTTSPAAPATVAVPVASSPAVAPTPAFSPAAPTSVPTAAASVSSTVVRLPEVPAESQIQTAQAAQAARQQADSLIASGDAGSAVIVLRKAVNQAPRSLALRASLAKAYLSAGRTNDAADEARRALTVTVPDSDREAWSEMTRVLATASKEIGDNKAARIAYEDIIKVQPTAFWARLALGDLLLAQGDTVGAETEYRVVRQGDPTNRAAILSMARVRMARGDFSGAIAEAVRGGAASGTPLERLVTNSQIFDEVAAKTAESVTQNRQAFDSGQLSREAFFKATQAQSARVDSLLSLLRSSAPPAESAEGVASPYRHRVSAAALLSQAVGSMLTFLESDDAKAGEQAKLLLGEFRKELAVAAP